MANYNSSDEFVAFISYRRVYPDIEAARKLHHDLETYRIPKNQMRDHDLPSNRMGQVFRDEEEIELTSDLNERLRGALERSRNLLVICSPRVVDQPWIDAEIRYFQKLGKGDRIYAVLIDGEEHSSFPKSLGLHVPVEPLGDRAVPKWADLRPGKSASFLKQRKANHKTKIQIIAALLGFEFDDLYQRDKQRKLRRLLATSLILGLIAISIGVLLREKGIADRIAKAQLLVSTMKDLSLRDQKPDLQLLLAYEAWRATSNLHISTVNDGLFRAIARFGGRPLPASGPCGDLKRVSIIRPLKEKQWLLVEGIHANGTGYICLWNLQHLENPDPPIALVKRAGENVISVNDEKQKKLVSFDRNGKFRIWDLEVLETIKNAEQIPIRTLDAKQLDGYSSTAGRITVDAAGRWIVGAAEGKVWVWSLLAKPTESYPKLLFAADNRWGIRRMQLSYDGNWLFLSTGSGPWGKVRLWRIGADQINDQNSFTIAAETDLFTDFAVFSPDNKWLLTADEGGYSSTKLIFWHLDTNDKIVPRTVRLSSGHAPPRIVVFSPDGQWLITAVTFLHGTPMIWNLRDVPEVAGTLQSEYLNSAAFDITSRGLFVVDSNNDLIYHDLTNLSKSQKEPMYYSVKSANNITASETGAWVIDDKICNENIYNQDIERTITRINADSRSFLSFDVGGCSAESVRNPFGANWWDIHSDDLFYLASGNSSRASFFLVDEKWLLNVGRIKKDGYYSAFKLLLLPLSPINYASEAKKLATRNMTVSEWERYMPGEEYRKTFEHLPEKP